MQSGGSVWVAAGLAGIGFALTAAISLKLPYVIAGYDRNGNPLYGRPIHWLAASLVLGFLPLLHVLLSSLPLSFAHQYALWMSDTNNVKTLNPITLFMFLTIGGTVVKFPLQIDDINLNIKARRLIKLACSTIGATGLSTLIITNVRY